MHTVFIRDWLSLSHRLYIYRVTETHSENHVTEKRSKSNQILILVPPYEAHWDERKKCMNDKHNSPNSRKGGLLLYHELYEASHKWKITARRKCLWKHFAKGNKGYPKQNRTKAERENMNASWLCMCVNCNVERGDKELPPATQSLVEGI